MGWPDAAGDAAAAGAVGGHHARRRGRTEGHGHRGGPHLPAYSQGWAGQISLATLCDAGYLNKTRVHNVDDNAADNMWQTLGYGRL